MSEFADDAQRYRLESKIATGGMGEVWRATDTTLNREVALKLLKPEFAGDATFRQRFAIEARHAASLHHANIAAVYDFGEDTHHGYGDEPPRPYLVMELVEGQPLSNLLRPGAPMAPDVVRDLLAQAADGLAAAHAAGIVHRDVKPANLLVTADRRVKITDFGIARAAMSAGVTQTGQVLGTPQYLSPEQARGDQATAASDVYALGVLAYECLAGRRPFVADTPVATALAHLNQPVPELPASVPADLAAVVYRALAKKPADRYADAAGFAEALRSPAVTTVIPTPEPVVEESRTQVLPPVAPAPVPMTTSTPMPPAPLPRAEEPRRNWGAGVFAILLLVVIAAIIGVLYATRDGSSTPTPEPTPTATTPSDSPSASATQPASVDIDPDDYAGRDYREVQAELKELGLNVTLDELANDGSQEAGTVDNVNPSGTLESGSTVTVTYWGPEPEPTPTPTPTPSPTPTPTPTPSPTPSAGLPTPTEGSS